MLTTVILICLFLIFICPLLVLVFSWWRANFKSSYLREEINFSSDMTGFGGLPQPGAGDQLIGLATTEETCQNGFYLGESEFVSGSDCATICNATNENQFEYKYIKGNDIIINNKYLKKGSWCLPTPLARCNLNISQAVMSTGRYECLSRHSQLLGGQFGNNITGCAPVYSFRDNLRKILYTDTVPNSLVIDDLDERIMGDDGQIIYRYECDTLGNRFQPYTNEFLGLQTRTHAHTHKYKINSFVGNRFQLHYNSCGFFDPDGKTTGLKCACSANVTAENVVKNEINGIEVCSTCTSGYGIIDEELPQEGSQYGVSVGINCVDPTYIEHYKTKSVANNGVIPCGTSTLLKLREGDGTKTYGCQRALLNVTNSYSPEMLKQING